MEDQKQKLVQSVLSTLTEQLNIAAERVTGEAVTSCEASPDNAIDIVFRVHLEVPSSVTARVRVARVEWNVKTQYRDDDYDPQEIDLRQDVLPFSK